MKSLVAAPAASRKHYSLPAWEEATRSYDRLLAISEPEYEPMVREMGIDTILFEVPETANRWGDKAIYGTLFNAAWKAILEHSDGYTHILSLESDVVPIKGVDILKLMEDEYDGSFQFLRHGVPWRAQYRAQGGYCYETGCCFASVDDWKAALELTPTIGPKETLYGVIGAPNYLTYKKVNITPLLHLDP